MTGTFHRGNCIDLLQSGGEYFPALLRAIESAQSEVRLETYIFEDDPTGRRIADALLAAAARGVNVHVAVDGFGSPSFMDGLGQMLTEGGVEVYVYRPELARFRLKRHRLRRLHRKLACIDASVAFVGGINLIDDLNPPNLPEPRLDYAVRVQGPLLADIHRTMLRLWIMLRWVNLGRRYRPRPVQLKRPRCDDNVAAALVIRDNLKHRREIERAYLKAILSAREEIIIANAYFLPGRSFRRALRAAAKRGVRVTLLLEGLVEYRLQYFATLALYSNLLGAGIRIFEYRKSYLHAKVAVVDGEWATVGSSNIDPFSLLLAREANVVVRNSDFARRLKASLEQAMQQGAVEIAGPEHLSRPRRLFGWLAYGLLRFVAGVAGYGRAL
ncbi:MAG TPA: cardiolipin synthase ClsB [Rhodocyclaceae bacterium]|nr:cardiolipin synthase ClsB [Rhodocyclaceae bacterium]